MDVKAMYMIYHQNVILGEGIKRNFVTSVLCLSKNLFLPDTTQKHFSARMRTDKKMLNQLKRS